MVGYLAVFLLAAVDQGFHTEGAVAAVSYAVHDEVLHNFKRFHNFQELENSRILEPMWDTGLDGDGAEDSGDDSSEDLEDLLKS